MMEVVRTDVMRGAFGRVAGGDRKGRFFNQPLQSDTGDHFRGEEW